MSFIDPEFLLLFYFATLRFEEEAAAEGKKCLLKCASCCRNDGDSIHCLLERTAAAAEAAIASSA